MGSRSGSRGIVRGHRCLASRNEELYQPALRVLLVWWVTLPYIFAGIVAWRRRPDSAFGPLMILAGFVTQLSILQWTSQPLFNTVGQLCDLLVAAVWLHVFLAYPSGRLAGRAERVVVIIGTSGRSGSPGCDLDAGRVRRSHLLTVAAAANRRGSRAERADFSPQCARAHRRGAALAALAVAAAVAAAPTTQILINCFSLSLVMLAALLIAGAFQLPGFEIIRLATFAVAGLAPLAFLAGLLDAASPRQGSASCWYSFGRIPLPTSTALLSPRHCAIRRCP